MKNNSKGVTAVEYGLIVGLISIAIIGSVALTGSNTKQVFCDVGETLSTHIGQSGIIPGCQANRFSIPDNIDPTIVDQSLGGSGYLKSIFGPTYNKLVLGQLEPLNEEDPITGIYGLYDANTNKPISDYATADSYLSNNGGLNFAYINLNYYEHEDVEQPVMQVETKSGQSYTLYFDPEHQSGTLFTNSWLTNNETGEEVNYME